MPTIKGFENKKGFRFFFTSHYWGEEAHIHAEGARGIIKIRLRDLKVEYSRGLNYSEESTILEIAEENQSYFQKRIKQVLSKSRIIYPIFFFLTFFSQAFFFFAFNINSLISK